MPPIFKLQVLYYMEYMIGQHERELAFLHELADYFFICCINQNSFLVGYQVGVFLEQHCF